MKFLAGKSNMTIPAIATIDARCGYFAWAMVGFRGVRLDPGAASDDRTQTDWFWMVWPEWQSI
jgi:hypothetical protein